MAGRSKQQQKKKENALVRYIRETRIELRKVHWPSRKETWALTKVVMAVTVGMAIFLGVLDMFFRWLLQGIVSENIWFVICGIGVMLALAASAVLIGRSEGA
ncbi:MAG: preprotein translocase subunit SecE [Chloroflexota bacterium]|nr:preprotein translocase subunit SecE [Chloroflexota bacterium]